MTPYDTNPQPRRIFSPQRPVASTGGPQPYSAPPAVTERQTVVSPVQRPASISFGRRDGSTANYPATEEQSATWGGPVPRVNPPAANPAALATAVTPAAEPSPFSSRGNSVPRGQDALTHDAGSGIYARKFASKASADFYSDYVRQLFEQNATPTGEGPMAYGKFTDTYGAGGGEAPTIEHPGDRQQSVVRPAAPKYEPRFAGQSAPIPTIEHPGDSQPRTVLRPTPARSGRISNRANPVPSAPTQDVRQAAPQRGSYLASPVPLMPKWSPNERH